MTRVLAAALLATAAFGARAAEDVPFVVTPDSVTMTMLEMARVTPKDYVIDLGSGDGRIVITAAKRFGAHGLGVEIVPDLVKQSRDNAARAGVAASVEFREEDLFKTDLSPATVVTMYLLPDVNLELRPKILALKPGTRIVSHDWDMGDWVADAVRTVPVPDKPIGLEKSSKVHLWIVPALLQGAWCGQGRAHGTTLEIEQKFQQFSATLARGDARHIFDGRIAGSSARSVDGDLGLVYAGERLRARSARGAFRSILNAEFTRRAGDACPSAGTAPAPSRRAPTR
jgi:SAM-dependent methyltransferase